MQYDKKYNLLIPRNKLDSPNKNRNKQFDFMKPNDYKKGIKVLYYIGPHKGQNGKWRQRWTGPWTIKHKINRKMVEIVDNFNKKKDVAVDRLKIFKTFKPDELIDWDTYNRRLDSAQNNKITMDEDDSDNEI